MLQKFDYGRGVSLDAPHNSYWIYSYYVHLSISLEVCHSTRMSKQGRWWANNKKQHQSCASGRISIVYMSHERKKVGKLSPTGISFASVAVINSFLAWRPVTAHAQLGPGDGNLLHAWGRTHLWRKVDDAAVSLYVLKFVLFWGLHVDDRILVNMFLQDHSLWGEEVKTTHQGHDLVELQWPHHQLRSLVCYEKGDNLIFWHYRYMSGMTFSYQKAKSKGQQHLSLNHDSFSTGWLRTLKIRDTSFLTCTDWICTILISL